MTSFASRALPVAFVLAALPAQASDKLTLEPDLLVTSVLLVSFILLISPLNRLIFQPLLKVMEERDQQIVGARARADHVQTQAQEALERYEDSIRTAHEAATVERRRVLDVAREELQAITRGAKSEADRELGRARDDLEGAVVEARESLRGSAEELASLAAERILGRSLS